MNQTMAVCAEQCKVVERGDYRPFSLPQGLCVMNFKTPLTDFRREISLGQAARLTRQLAVLGPIRAPLGFSELPASLAPEVSGKSYASFNGRSRGD